MNNLNVLGSDTQKNDSTFIAYNTELKTHYKTHKVEL